MMKKNIMVVAACVATAFLQGMENQNSVSFLIGKTTVRLTKGCIYDFDRAVDLMVVGENEQRILKGTSTTFMGCAGEVQNKIVYIKSKGTDSPFDSDDDIKTRKSWHDAPTKQLHCRVISVVEPRIVQERYYCEVCTFVEPCFLYRKNQWLSGNEAMIKAKKDLACCYEEAFLEGKKAEKSIAIPFLGVGFPMEDAASVAVATISEFIRTNKNNHIEPYDLIYLVVKKQRAFDLYKKMLEVECNKLMLELDKEWLEAHEARIAESG